MMHTYHCTITCAIDYKNLRYYYTYEGQTDYSEFYKYAYGKRRWQRKEAGNK